MLAVSRKMLAYRDHFLRGRDGLDADTVSLAARKVARAIS